MSLGTSVSGANKERVAKSGLASVHAEHYKRIADIVKKYGKKPMMYGDIILNQPEILGRIPERYYHRRLAL